MYKIWDDEDNILLGTIPDRKLALQLNCSQVTIWKRRKKLNIPACDSRGAPKGPRPKTLKILSEITDNEFLTKPAYAISKEHHIPDHAVRREIQKRGLKPPFKRGRQAGSTTLQVQVYKVAIQAVMREFVSKYKKPGLQATLARIFHISRERVRQIVNKMKKEGSL